MKKKRIIIIGSALLACLIIVSIGFFMGMSMQSGRNVYDMVGDAGMKEAAPMFEERKMDYPAEEEKLYTEEAMDKAAADSFEDPQLQSASYINAAAVQKEKLIIRNDLTVETKNFSSYIEELEKLVVVNQAYIQEQNMYNGSISGNEVRNAFYVIRVPKTQAANFADSLKKLEGKITRQQVSVENVTQQYFDIKRRVGLNKAKEDRLTELLKKAENMKDLIAIEKEIAGLVSERESMETDLISLDHNVSYDYYTMNIEEVREYQEVKKKKSFGADLTYAFDSSIRNFVGFIQELVLFFVYSWIFWLILVVIVLVVKKLIKRKLIKRKQEKKETDRGEINGE